MYREPSGKRQREPLSVRRPVLAPGVYFVGAGNGAVKVGFSARPAYRVDELQTSNPLTLTMFAVVRRDTVEEARALEATIHDRLKQAGRHIRGEWFRLWKAEASAIAAEYAGAASGA